MAEAEAADKPRIVWGLAQPPKPASILNAERDKHKKRAEKFATKFVEPSQRSELLLEAKKERWNREGFTTGFDVFSKEEVDKRRSRAERFQISAPVLDYRPDEEEEAKKRRAGKFGTAYQPTDQALMDMDLFEERREVPLDTERRPDAIHLYGVDVMSTAEVLRYFSDYGPTFVEWLDDSSCNVQFKDPHSVKRAIAGMGKPFPPEDSATTTGLDPTNPDNMPYFWHRGSDFLKDGTAVKLVYRMATALDVKDRFAPRKTRELWKTAGAIGSKRSRDLQGKTPLKPRSTSVAEGHGLHQQSDMMDLDGGRQRGERGGRRQRRRKARHNADGEGTTFDHDVDMQDIEDDDVEDEPAVQTWREAKALQPVSGDLRRAIKARRQHGHDTVADNDYDEGREGFDMGPPRELLRGYARPIEVVLVVPPNSEHEPGDGRHGHNS